MLENSGVAEPSNIRDKFREAEEQGHPLLQRLYLDTLVTVVRSTAAACTTSSSSRKMPHQPPHTCSRDPREERTTAHTRWSRRRWTRRRLGRSLPRASRWPPAPTWATAAT